MMTVVPDPAELSRALMVETKRVAQLLRAGGDPGASVPGLAWTALQAASHLSVALHAFATTVQGQQVPLDLPAGGPAQTMPAFLAAANEVTLQQSGCTTLAEAADAVEAGGQRMVSALTDRPDPGIELDTPWYGPGQTRTAGTLGALAVSETIVHGYDLAGALGGDRRVPVRSSRAAAATVMSQMLPLLVDPALPEDFRVRYGIRIRGSESFVVQLDGRRAWTSPPDDDVDCVINLTAPMALLLGFRRIPLWRAVLTGGALSSGRRPWAGFRFSSAFLSA